MTRAWRAERWPWIWAAICMVLLIALAGVTVGYVAARRATEAAHRGTQAALRAAEIANCVNDTLGVRQQLTERDHANEAQKIADQLVAEQDKARGLTELETSKTHAGQVAGFELYKRGVDEFVRSLASWTARDQAIAAERAKHPLGRC